MNDFDPRLARKTRRYQREREMFLLKNPLCAMCKERGIIKVADELDHKIPVHKAPEKFWTKSNWQGLCQKCHATKSAQEDAKRRQADLSPEVLKWRQDPLKFD